MMMYICMNKYGPYKVQRTLDVFKGYIVLLMHELDKFIISDSYSHCHSHDL